MASEEEVAGVLSWTAFQADSYEKRAKSRIEKQYSDTMRQSAAALVKVTCTASFEQLIRIERAFQQNDLAVYAQVPSTKQTVEEGIDDLDAGEAVYKQLLTDTNGYKAHKYREKERVGPGKMIPLDAMRRALRGQAKRVENYRKNVMGNPHEYEFMSARMAMLRRAEKLYDAIQQEHLLPPEQ